jgi:hypothetical protein
MKPHVAMRLGFASALAARAGDADLARTASEAAEHALQGLQYPVATQMTRLALAQQRLSAGDSDAALEALAVVPPDAMLLALRPIGVEALALAGRSNEAAAAAESLARMRGRAYTEVASYRMLVPRNVVDTNLALLRAAELQLGLGQFAQAESSLQTFDRVWPASRRPPALRARFDAVRAALDGR